MLYIKFGIPLRIKSNLEKNGGGAVGGGGGGGARTQAEFLTMQVKKGLLQVRGNHAVERSIASEGKPCFRKICSK